MASENVPSGSGNQYQPITDEDTLTRLRAQGLTDKGFAKVTKGDLRCRPPRQITDTYFDKKLPQFRLKTVVDTARAEDVVMVWAYITRRVSHLRDKDFRFHPNIYLSDAELLLELQALSNSSDEMVEYLKARFGTLRHPQVTAAVPPTTAPELPPDIQQLIYAPGHVALPAPSRVEVTDTVYKNRFSKDLVRAVHKAAWDGQAKATFDLATTIGDFNVRFSKYQYTPLHQTVLGANTIYNVLTAERLLVHGGDVDAADIFGKTPLYHASRRNNVDMMELLLSKGARVNDMACDGSTPLHAAAESGAVDAVMKLLERGATEIGSGGCGTPLHWAARAGRHQVVRVLVEKQFDVNAIDWYQSTPLHVAARCEGGKDVLRLLLAYRAERDARDVDGRTALYVAVTSRLSQCVQTLSAGIASQDVPTVLRLADADLELQKQRIFWDDMTEDQVSAFAETYPQRELSWMDWFVLTRNYVNKHGMLPGTPELGWWYRYHSHHKSSLGAWQIKELESLPGFMWWEPLHQKLRCLSRYMRLKLYVTASSYKRKRMKTFGSWRHMILTLKEKNALSEEQLCLLERYSQGPYHDDFWGTREPEPPQQQPQPQPLPQTYQPPTEARPALDIIDSLRNTNHRAYSRLRTFLSSDLKNSDNLRRCFDLWREFNLFGGTELPWRPGGGVYILHTSPRGIKDGYEYMKESRRKGVTFIRKYATTTDGTMQRRILQEIKCDPHHMPLIIVEYIPQSNDPQSNDPSPMDLLVNAAASEQTASVHMDEDQFRFLTSVPKRQRTRGPSNEFQQNIQRTEATLAALSKELEVVYGGSTQVLPRIVPDPIPEPVLEETEGAQRGETVTSDTTKVSVNLRELLSRTSSDNALAMGMALKALYDQGIGGSDMRWAASHIVGKKLGAEEKKYIFDSVKEYVLKGKIEEAVEWVKEIKGAMDF